MTVTSSGIKCDVCGTYVLPIAGDETYTPFKLAIIKEQLHACDKCIVIIKSLDTNQGGDGDWKKLPEGPLREVFEELEKRCVLDGQPDCQNLHSKNNDCIGCSRKVSDG